MIHTYEYIYYIAQFTLVSVCSYITNLLISALNGNRKNWQKPVEGDPTATALILKEQQ